MFSTGLSFSERILLNGVEPISATDLSVVRSALNLVRGCRILNRQAGKSAPRSFRPSLTLGEIFLMGVVLSPYPILIVFYWTWLFYRPTVPERGYFVALPFWTWIYRPTLLFSFLYFAVTP